MNFRKLNVRFPALNWKPYNFLDLKHTFLGPSAKGKKGAEGKVLKIENLPLFGGTGD